MMALLAVGIIGALYLYETGKVKLPGLTTSPNLIGKPGTVPIASNSSAANNSVLASLIKGLTTTQQQQQQQQQAKPSSSGGSGGGAPIGSGNTGKDSSSGKAGTSGIKNAGVTGQQQSDALTQWLMNSDFTGPQSIAIENTLRDGGSVADAANAAGVDFTEVIQALTGANIGMDGVQTEDSTYNGMIDYESFSGEGIDGQQPTGSADSTNYGNTDYVSDFASDPELGQEFLGLVSQGADDSSFSQDWYDDSGGGGYDEGFF